MSGSPAGLLDLRRLKKNKRVIPDPSSFAAGEFQFGSNPKMLTDPTDRVCHATIFRGAKIIDRGTMRRFPRGALFHDV